MRLSLSRAPDLVPDPSEAGETATAPLLAALGGFTAIAVNLTLLLAVRRGLAVEPWLIALLVAYAAAVISCAAAIEIFLADALRRALTQLMALVALLVLPIVFFGVTQWLLALLVAIAAWIALTRVRRTALRAQPRLLVWLGAALGAIVAVGLYGLAGFQHEELQSHFLMPEYGRLGLLHKDPFVFVGFAAEIMNGRWPGAALDGLRPIFYHFGAPLFLASFALTSGSSPFHAYMAGQQLLFIPLVVFYAGLAASSLARCAGAPARVGAIAVVLGVAGVLAVPALRWPIIYYSESSAASAPLTFMMLPLAAAWLSSNPGRARSIGHALAIVMATLASASFKFSTAVTVGALAFYLILRRHVSERQGDAATMVALVLAIVLAVGLWPALFGRDFVIQLWASQDNFLKVRGEAAWALAMLATAFVLQQICRAVGCDLERMRSVWHALLIMFPVAVVGGWLIANLHDVYNSRYLYNSLLLLTLPLIALSAAALLNLAFLSIEHRIPVLGVAALPAMGLLLVLITTLGLQAGRAAPSHAAQTISAAKEKMCERAVPESICRASVPRAFRTASADFVAAIEQGIGPRMLAVLKDSPAGDAFFVPPGNEAYWRFVLGGLRPFENLNFLPAHFGTPLLLGLPPATYGVDAPLISRAMLGRYGESARSHALSDRELCRHARERAIGRVVVFESLQPPHATRLLDCRQGG